MFIYTCDGVLGESLELLKGSQASCHVRWGMQDGSGANAPPHVVVRGDILWLFSSCSGNLGFPLEL